MSAVIVARQFRGAALYLVRVRARGFVWSNDRTRALPVSVLGARGIIGKVEAFERGAHAFAIDKAGAAIVPCKSKRGAVRVYNAIMRRARRAMAGGLAFGMDWPTFRASFPEDYARICDLRARYGGLPS